MKSTDCTAEAFAYGMMVTSLLDPGRMVLALATTSSYPVMVTSVWGSSTGKMWRNGKEAPFIRKMERRRSMTSD